MPYAECIVFTFEPGRKSGNAFEFSVGMKPVSSAGENFMPISLMTHIPYQLIVGRVKDIVNSYRKFHHPQACTKMSTVNRYGINNVLAQLLAQLMQLVFAQLTKITRKINI